jgi:hypothetical protein
MYTNKSLRTTWQNYDNSLIYMTEQQMRFFVQVVNNKVQKPAYLQFQSNFW